MKKTLPDHPHLIDTYIQAYLQDAHSKTFEGVVVYDGVCGIGKTTSIFDHINDHVILKNANNRVIFVGTYLSELHRVAGTKAQKNKKSQPPIRGKDKKVTYADSRLFKGQFTHLETMPNKMMHLVTLLNQNKDIVMTHSMFNKLNKECLDIIKSKNYHIIIDEEPKVIQLPDELYKHSFKGSSIEHELKQKEINELLKIGVINNHGGEITWGQHELDRYKDFRTDVDAKRIVVYNQQSEDSTDKIFLWRQNPEVFTAFKTVHVLTYLFKDSFLQAYFDICKIPYLIKNRTVEEALDNNKLRPYHSLIHVHKLDSFNTFVQHGEQLTSSWYNKFISHYNSSEENDIRKKLTSFFKSKLPYENREATEAEKMWSTYGDFIDWVKGKGYTKGFVAFNARATNEYKHKKQLAFTVNVYANPILINYCNSFGCSVDHNSYATSTLVQWIFRSALREGKHIHLMLPSKRMQRLLKAWMSKLKDLYEHTRLIANNDKLQIAKITADKSLQNIRVQDYLTNEQPGLRHLPNLDIILESYKSALSMARDSAK